MNNVIESTATELVTLSYNAYKGTGKAWIAEIDPRTRKIIAFLDAESHEKIGTYKGEKRFLVPLVEGKCYKTREEGSKSCDTDRIYLVKNGELVQQ
jgi:hypothetical protein